MMFGLWTAAFLIPLKSGYDCLFFTLSKPAAILWTIITYVLSINFDQSILSLVHILLKIIVIMYTVKLYEYPIKF